jgi:hypothetical protein
LEINNLLREAKAQRDLHTASELFPGRKYRDEEGYSYSFMMADAMSMFWTRRIQANPKPAGVFSCRTCHDLDFRRGMPQDASIVYFMAVKVMDSAVSAGCRGCRFLSDCLVQVRHAYGAAFWDLFSGDDLVLSSMAQGAPLLLHHQSGSMPSIPSKQVEIYVKEGNISVLDQQVRRY